MLRRAITGNFINGCGAIGLLRNLSPWNAQVSGFTCSLMRAFSSEKRSKARHAITSRKLRRKKLKKAPVRKNSTENSASKSKRRTKERPSVGSRAPEKIISLRKTSNKVKGAKPIKIYTGKQKFPLITALKESDGKNPEIGSSSWRRHKVGKFGKGMSLLKFLSYSGIESRRSCVAIINEGHIFVNSKKVLNPARILDAMDVVQFKEADGTLRFVKLKYDATKTARVFLYNKPNGEIVSRSENNEGSKGGFIQMFKRIEKAYPNVPRLVSVGRLDATSDGLILLSDNPKFCHAMEHPSSGIERIYIAKVHGTVREDNLEKLAKGFQFRGVHYEPMKLEIMSQRGRDSQFKICLKEGKNREIRNAFSAIGMVVSQLTRVQYGPYQLSTMLPGELREVSLKPELAALLKD